MDRHGLELEHSVNRLLGTQRTEAIDKLHFYLEGAKFITMWGRGETVEAVKQARNNLVSEMLEAIFDDERQRNCLK